MTLEVFSKNQMPQVKLGFNMPTSQELEQITNFCLCMSKSKFYEKIGAYGILAIYMTARELDLPFMACLNGGVYTFDGKISLSAQLMAMLINRAGHSYEILKLTDQECEIKFKRHDRENFFTYSYDLAKAEKAGYLRKDNWRQNPRDMLYNRCLSGGARKFMPEVLMSYYVEGEIIEDEEKTKGNFEPEKPKEIAFEKPIGYDDFIKNHALDVEGDAKSYVEHVSKISSKPFENVVKLAMLNEEKFLSGIEKWREENQKQIDLEPIDSM